MSTVSIGLRRGELSLFGERELIRNDTVEALKGQRNYLIAMREGGFIRIHSRQLTSWTVGRGGYDSWPIFDYKGDWYDEEETTGPDGEPYLLPPRPRKKAA